MADRVEISFVGVTTFVRDQPNSGELEALMPNLYDDGAIPLPGAPPGGFLRHEPRLLFQGSYTGSQTPTTGLSCYGNESWQQLDLYGKHVEVGPQAGVGLGLGALDLPRIDLLANGGQPAPLAAGVTDPNAWPSGASGQFPLLSSRIVLRWGEAETIYWHCRYYFDDPSSLVRLAHVVILAADVTLPVSMTIANRLSRGSAETAVFDRAGGNPLKIRFENNCVRPAPGTGCPEGTPDFLAHYGLLAAPPTTPYVPTREPGCVEPPPPLAGDAQCSPGEHGG